MILIFIQSAETHIRSTEERFQPSTGESDTKKVAELIAQAKEPTTLCNMYGDKL